MRDLVLLARKDDDKKVLILKRFEPLLKRACSLYVKNKSYFEDAMQEGRIVILKCIENYDLSSKCPFEAYVKRAVVNKMREFSVKANLEYVSLDQEITEDGENMYEIIPSDFDLEGESIKEENIKRLYEALYKLTKKQREVIIDFYFKNKSMVEIAQNKRCHYMAIARLKV